MSGGNRFIGHVAAAAIAAGVAYWVWTADDQPGASGAQEVNVWAGTPTQVTKLKFAGDQLSLVLTTKEDATGRYYVGEATRTKERPVPGAQADKKAAGHDHGGDDGHGHDHGGDDDHGHGHDHGADDGQHADAGDGTAGDAKPPAKMEVVEEKKHFISVTTADALLERLAPLVADRDIGQVESERVEAFGFGEDAPGTLEVYFSGAPRELAFGGSTPGGGDRYARTSDGDVYAVSGAILRDLKGGQARLMQRRLHSWKLTDASRVRVTSGADSREFVPVEGKAGFWADNDGDGSANETAGNWLTKLARLQASKYEGPEFSPKADASSAFRVEFFDGDTPIGFTEVAQGANDDQGKPTFLVRSELTRWWASAPRTTSEALTQDVKSVVE